MGDTGDGSDDVPIFKSVAVRNAVGAELAFGGANFPDAGGH